MKGRVYVIQHKETGKILYACHEESDAIAFTRRHPEYVSERVWCEPPSMGILLDRAIGAVKEEIFLASAVREADETSSK